jgi:hypothetical protein
VAIGYWNHKEIYLWSLTVVRTLRFVCQTQKTGWPSYVLITERTVRSRRGIDELAVNFKSLGWGYMISTTSNKHITDFADRSAAACTVLYIPVPDREIFKDIASRYFTLRGFRSDIWRKLSNDLITYLRRRFLQRGWKKRHALNDFRSSGGVSRELTDSCYNSSSVMNCIHTSYYPLLTPVRNPSIKYFSQISLPIHIPGDDVGWGRVCREGDITEGHFLGLAKNSTLDILEQPYSLWCLSLRRIAVSLHITQARITLNIPISIVRTPMITLTMLSAERPVFGYQLISKAEGFWLDGVVGHDYTLIKSD